MTEITLNGKTYQMDWTVLSMAYLQNVEKRASFAELGNLTLAAVMIAAALRGGDWTFDKDADWVLSQVGHDLKKLNELSTIANNLLNEFNHLNAVESGGNVEAPEGAKN